MNTDFTPILAAAVRHAKAGQQLIWVDLLAARIAEATPLPVRNAELAEQLTLEAIRQGAPVKMARPQAGPDAGD